MINDYRKIKSPDYAESQERMNTLHNMIVDGRDAEAVYKYADVFLKECGQAVLDYAKKGQTELMNEAALEYKVAFKFMELLKHAVDTGKAKEEKLSRIKQNR